MQDNWPSVLFAMAGGVVLSIGNLSTQYSLALVGLSVTEVITSSIIVVIGLSLSLSLSLNIHRQMNMNTYIQINAHNPNLCMYLCVEMHFEKDEVKARQDSFSLLYLF